MAIDEKRISDTLIVSVCGLPASGKSSLCSEIAHQLRNVGINVAHVSFDAIADINRGEQPWSPEAWHVSRLAALEMLKQAVEQAPAPGSRTLILADDNAWYRSMRRQVYRLARDANETVSRTCAYATLYVAISAEGACARDSMRDASSRVGPDVIQRMASAFEEPGHCAASAGRDQAAGRPSEEHQHSARPATWESPHTFVIDGARPLPDSFHTVLSWLGDGTDASPWSAGHIPTPPAMEDQAALSAARARTEEDMVHQGDLMLRKLVGQAIAAADPGQRKSLSQTLAEARPRALQRLRDAVKRGLLQLMMEDDPGVETNSTRPGWYPALEHTVAQLWAEEAGGRRGRLEVK